MSPIDVRRLGGFSVTAPMMREKPATKQTTSTPVEKIQKTGEVSQVIGAVVDVQFGKFIEGKVLRVANILNIEVWVSNMLPSHFLICYFSSRPVTTNFERA